MNSHVLTTPSDADALVARMFRHRHTCSIAVREDKAFKADGWLSLGSLSVDVTGDSIGQLTAAVRRGGFEWNVLSQTAVETTLTDLLQLKDSDKAKNRAKLRRALDATAAVAVRAGLRHPRFDPQALEAMPFRRSTTVVVDTSGAVQGGLDFVARHLHPAARIKIPAVVQMEVVNSAERFLSGRRSVRTRAADLLIDHLISQGGQRVLLRLELRADTEIERNFLLGDPLRNAFQHDSDSDLTDLNLSVPVRAYVDRLILEAARQHQAQSNIGHRVQLLTSDQGLARMALAEGIAPLFFSSVVSSDIFGKRLSGATLDPFTGRLRATSLTSVLWEFATAFGCVRVQSDDEAHTLVISAFGEGLSWSPYHSQADLLWCDHSRVPDWDVQLPPSSSTSSIDSGARPLRSQSPNDEIPAKRFTRKRSQAAAVTTTGAAPVSLQRFNVGTFFGLVDFLDTNQSISEEKVISVVGARNRDGVEEYRRFLSSGGLVSFEDGAWRAEPKTQMLAVALRNDDVPTVRDILTSVPSFAFFVARLQVLSIGQIWDPTEFGRSANTYRTLGEVTQLCAPIFDEGVYSTNNTPNISAFAVIALERFQSLDKGDGWVATGAWLEELIRRDGIHPEVARNRVNDASASNILRRSTEGSTTELRFDKHAIQVLRSHGGKPGIEQIHLYRGDYLIPGKSSTSLKIESVPS